MGVKYCPGCKRNVNTEHSWNDAVLVILFLFLLIPGIIYAIIKWHRRCPMCKMNDNMLELPKFDNNNDQKP
jgi:RNA polymerase subunit RPABC4/transcription elongation factor Spt4